MHDLLIRNALTFDGSGAPAVIQDLAVSQGRIVAMGAGLAGDDAHAQRVIDATGLALMPGIIDSHTHFDAQITWDRHVRPSPALGVTTAVIGNCGFTIAPCRPEHRELTMRNLTQVEGMSLDVLRQGIHWGFESFAEYLDHIRPGLGINVGALIGHSALRMYVMGAASQERAATPDEIEQMCALVRAAMQAGAMGISSSYVDIDETRSTRR